MDFAKTKGTTHGLAIRLPTKQYNIALATAKASGMTLVRWSQQMLLQAIDGKIPQPLEVRIARWVQSRLGYAHMQRDERAARVLEEAIEFAQAEGILPSEAQKLIEHIYARKAGVVRQEAGGLAVCIYAWCASLGMRFEEIIIEEIERIEAKSIEEIQASLDRKFDAGLISVSRETEKPVEIPVELPAKKWRDWADEWKVLEEMPKGKRMIRFYVLADNRKLPEGFGAMPKDDKIRWLNRNWELAEF